MSIDERVSERMNWFAAGVSYANTGREEPPRLTEDNHRAYAAGHAAYLAAEQAERERVSYCNCCEECDKALLEAFCEWVGHRAGMTLTDEAPVHIDAFLAARAPAPGPLPSCPVCGAVRGDWECRHGAKDEPAPSLDRCLSCSVGVLDARLGGMCGDYPGDCPPAPPAELANCPNCGHPRHDKVPYCAPPAPPLAPEGERFWTVDRTLTGEHWRAYQTSASGTVVLGFERLWDTRAEAEADGRASGLKEWKP